MVTTSVSTNTIFQNPNSNIVLINPANQINSIKLSDDNYLLWNIQVLAGIRGLGLEIFIMENPHVPSQVVSTEDGSDAINSQFVTWCRQNQLLFSFLLASMTESVQSQMIGCDTYAQLWTRVSRLFASRSKAKAMQYKLQLQTLKKEGLSMKDYIIKMKGYMDVLATCGHAIYEEDQILYILGGVGLEYDSVVVHVTSRVDSISFPDVGALLLAHEGRLDSFDVSGDSSTPTVNVVTGPSFKKTTTPYQSSSFSLRGRGRGRSGRGGRKPWSHNNGRPICQI